MLRLSIYGPLFKAKMIDKSQDADGTQPTQTQNGTGSVQIVDLKNGDRPNLLLQNFILTDKPERLSAV